MALEPEVTEPKVYEYASLTGRKSHFRLLTIHPSKSDKSPLTLSLVEWRIDDCVPTWDAISYHWGNSEKTRCVTVDNQSLRINENAFSAIFHCRLKDRPRIVWIDQICINQEDERERLEQIMLMGRIFREAVSVVAYLCDAWPDLETFFAYLNIIGSKPKFWNLAWWQPWKKPPKDSPMKSMFEPDESFPARTWEKLSCFNDRIDIIVRDHDAILGLPWFQRTWIVQEAGLAQKLQIQCSYLTASWDSFIVARDRIVYGPKQTLQQATAHGLRSICAIEMIRLKRPGQRPLIRLVWNELLRSLKSCSWTQYWTAFKNAARRLMTTTYPELLGVLRHFRYQHSTDKRDKIFGLLGLAEPYFADALIDTAHDFEKPYAESISFLCYHFASWQIMCTGTLDVLMATCFGARAHEDLPYWVPDWSQEAPLCDTEWVYPLKKMPHRAGTQYPAYFEFIAKEKALITRGIVLDVVDEVVEESMTIDELDDPSHPVWKAWTRFAMQPASGLDPYMCESGRYDAYWRTLVYNSDGSEYLATESTGVELAKWLEQGTIVQKRRKINIIGGIVFRGRKLFRTRRGYLGNACAAIEVGDKVCVLQGGRLPFVLRKDREVQGVPTATSQNNYEPIHKILQGYKMIGGDAYVHGICEGQVWQMAEQEGMLIQEIALI